MDRSNYNDDVQATRRLDSMPSRTVRLPHVGSAPAERAPVTPSPAQHPVQQSPRRTSRPTPKRRRSPKHPFLSAILWLITLAIMGAMALRYAPSVLSNGKLIPEIASFIPYLVIPSAIILVPAIAWRRRMLTVVTIACLAVQAVWHAGYFMPAQGKSTATTQAVTAASTQDDVLRVMTLNTAVGQASANEIVALVRDQHVEVLALQELTDTMLVDLRAAGLYRYLPYSMVGEATGNDNGGRNGLWTLAPMSNLSSSLLPTAASASPGASIQVGTRTLRLVSVHPSSPYSGARGFWNAGLQSIRSLAQYEHDYVIMGDFNSTWDHSRFRKLLGSAFVDASQQAGEGFHNTWPSDPSYLSSVSPVTLPLPPVIEIDHILYARDSGISAGSLQTVKVSGTDHMALLATLVVE